MAAFVAKLADVALVAKEALVALLANDAVVAKLEETTPVTPAPFPLNEAVTLVKLILLFSEYVPAA